VRDVGDVEDDEPRIPPAAEEQVAVGQRVVEGVAPVLREGGTLAAVRPHAGIPPTSGLDRVRGVAQVDDA
jgi:hypothetical protein